MAKRLRPIGRSQNSKSRKTAKRLEIKRVMLEEKAKKKTK